MKISAILFLTAFASGSALAASPGELNLSGTQLTQEPTTVKGTEETTTTKSTQLKAATIYDLVSNAVANVGTYGTSVTSTNLPANGYIAFDALGYDNNVGGTFYVTNKSGFYYPLSGYDVNSNYYSFIELDTYNNDTNASVGSLDFGFSNPFSGVQSSKYNSSNGNGSATVTSSGLFYVHDNPYAFDNADTVPPYNSNATAFELRGKTVTTINYQGGNVKSWSVGLTGTGTSTETNQTSIIDGTVSFSQGAPVSSGSTGGGTGNGGGNVGRR